MTWIKFTHQAHKDAEQLDHICVRNGIKSSDESVKDGYQCGDHHRHVDVDVHNHAECGTWVM